MDYKRQAENQLYSASFDKSDLADLTGIVIPDADAETKMYEFIKAAGNPYLFRVGDIGVHVVFSGKKGDTLQQRICHLLSNTV